MKKSSIFTQWWNRISKWTQTHLKSFNICATLLFKHIVLKKALDTQRQVLPLQGYYAAVQELADCAVKGRGSDPDGHASLWGPDCECDRGPHLDCCHSQSGARNVARAGGQALHVGGWCRRGSP